MSEQELLRGGFRLRKQAAGRGMFADVRLKLEASGSIFRINFRPEPGKFVLEHYLDSAKAGIRFANDRLSSNPVAQTMNQVTLTEVTGTDCDTTQIMIFYAAAMAYFNAVGEDAERHLHLDLADRSITFRV